MKTMTIMLASVLMSIGAHAKDINVESVRCTKPISIVAPVMLDSTDVSGKPFDAKMLLDQPLNLKVAEQGEMQKLSNISLSTSSEKASKGGSCCGGTSLSLLQFFIESTSFEKVTFEVKGISDYQVYVDGRRADGEQQLMPATHSIVIKCLNSCKMCAAKQSTDSAKADKPAITIKGATDNMLLVDGSTRLFGMTEVNGGTSVRNVKLSHDGRYMIATYGEEKPDGRYITTVKLTDRQTGHTLREGSTSMDWDLNSNAFITRRQQDKLFDIVLTDVLTGSEQVLARDIDAQGFIVTPDHKSIILNKEVKGPEEDKDAYEIIDPDDRQPGWRNRSTVVLYDVATGMEHPLTYGHANIWVNDVSQDSRYLLFSTSKRRLEQRPTSLMSIYRLDLQSMNLQTVVADDGFISDASFASSDGSVVVVAGSPESFGGIGENLPEGMTPSMIEHELFAVDMSTKKVTPLTRDFNPSIDKFAWNRAANALYFTAEERDSINLFRMDMKTHKIKKMPVNGETITSFSVADDAPVLAHVALSASAPSRLYTMNTRTLKSTLVDDPRAEQLKGVQLSKVNNYSFRGFHGDTITGFYMLPPHFDETKKYPMLVYYYGGCSPTDRWIGNSYPFQSYAAQGYVMLIINPSGATGFGQEFAARHVNTAGKGVAEDIIMGTKNFYRTHAYVDSTKIGCFGASYGGFMTQYLCTQTDLFAAAVSHAGISDHTGYWGMWGMGYWGYSYSETSMANRYPWSDKQLYVDQSPLYNADKIHTPLLLLHGNSDHNVPYSQSVQMYTALRLLGRTAAFVTIDGEDHIIRDYHKRNKWINNIFAWFAKYLKDEPQWWDTLHKEKKL